MTYDRHLIIYVSTIIVTLIAVASCHKSATYSKNSYRSEILEITKHVEQAYWQAENQRTKDFLQVQTDFISWDTFAKEHEVIFKGIHVAQSDPPVYTAVVRMHIPELKNAHYEFHFEHRGLGWTSTEASIISPNHQRNYYQNPYPGSKNLKEYFPAALKKLGAPILIEESSN